MTHKYSISGMICGGCQQTVKNLLSRVENVTDVQVSLEEGTATVSMERHIPTSELQAALKLVPQYRITEHSA